MFWNSTGQDGSGSGVYGQHYNPLGIPQGTEFRVSSTTEGDQWVWWNNCAAMNTEGKAVVVWSGYALEDDYGIFGQRLAPIVHDGGGIYSAFGGTVITQNTLIAGNMAVHVSPDVAGAVGSLGGNLVGDIDGAVGLDVEMEIIKPEFRVNSATAGTQYFAAIAMNSLGRSVVVWEGDRDGTYDLYAQRYDELHRPVGSEMKLADTSMGESIWPSVAMDANGNFVVAWHSYWYGDGTEVFLHRFLADGTALGSPVIINSYHPGNQGLVDLAMASTGEFVAVWKSEAQDGSEYGIFAQYFNADGTPRGEELQVNTTIEGYQEWPRVAMDAVGNFVVTWYGPATGPSGSEIFARSFSAVPAPISEELLVNTTTAGSQDYPFIAMDSTGSFVITWTSDGQDGSGLGVFARQFNSAGSPTSEELLVNTFLTGDQQGQEVAVYVDGSFVVTWVSWHQDGNLTGVFAQRLDGSGNRVGVEFRVNATVTGNQGASRVAMNYRGDFFVVWTGTGPGDNDGDLRYRV